MINISNVTIPALKNSINMITGYGWFDKEIKLFLKTADNNISLDIVKQNDNSIYFKMPDIKNATGTLVLECDNEVISAYINNPILDWCFGESFSYGEMVRLFGKALCDLNLFIDDEGLSTLKNGGIELYIKNDIISQTVEIDSSSFYEIRFKCPELPYGSYEVFAMSNGIKSNALQIEITKSTLYDTIFNVFDYGAVADGVKDDSIAINNAIREASNAGGGIVYLPSGNYFIKNTIHILPNITIRGENRNRTWIWTPTAVGLYGDRFEGEALDIILTGDRDFSVENLSIFSVYSKSILVAPTNFCKDMKNFSGEVVTHVDCDTPEAKNIRITNCHFEINRTYRHHYRIGEPYLANVTHDKHCKWGDYYIVCYRGDNLSIEGSVVRSAGGGILLKGVKSANISNNKFYAGSSGNALSVFPSFVFREMDGNNNVIKQPKMTENLIFQNNISTPISNIVGNNICFMTHSKNAFIANNKLNGSWERDSECIVWHSWGIRWPFKVQKSKSNSIEFSMAEAKAHIENLVNKSTVYFNSITGIAFDNALVGFEVIVIDGKGLSQKHTVQKNIGNTIYLDKDFEVVPNESSMFVLSEFAHYENNIVVGNDLDYTGPGIYMWGSGYNNIFEGNTLTRTAGIILQDLGGHPRMGWVWAGNYFHRILNNTISCGRYDGQSNPFDSFYGKRQSIVGNCNSSIYGIATYGMILDKNKITEDGYISVVGEGGGKAYGVIVEDNLFKNSTIGIAVEGDVDGIMFKNQFENVMLPIKTTKNNLKVLDEKPLENYIEMIKKSGASKKINYCKLLQCIGINLQKYYHSGEAVVVLTNANDFDVPCNLELLYENKNYNYNLVIKANETQRIVTMLDVKENIVYRKQIDISSKYTIENIVFENRAFLIERQDAIKNWQVSFLDANNYALISSVINLNKEFINFLEYDGGKNTYWASSKATLISPKESHSTIVIDFRGPFQAQLADQWWADGGIKLFLNGEEKQIFGNAFRGVYPESHMEQESDIVLKEGENILEIRMFKFDKVEKCDLIAYLISNEKIVNIIK